jgi:TonB family protein
MVIAIMALTFGYASDSEKFTDRRDGKTYKTVKMPDGKVWFAENLNYQTGNSWCYENENPNCMKYGRLYDWATSQKACPEGWHLPSDDEWNELTDCIGGSGSSGKKLKAKNGWVKEGIQAVKCANNRNSGSAGSGGIRSGELCDDEGGNGTDDYGFSALPGGWLNANEKFINGGHAGFWWSSSEKDAKNALQRLIDFRLDGVSRSSDPKTYGGSVRCVNDVAQKKTCKQDTVKLGIIESAMILRKPTRDKQEIMKVINASMHGLRAIYTRYLKLYPGFSGKVVVKFTILPSGEAVNIQIVSSTTDRPDFDEEIKNNVETWKWEAVGSGNVTPTIPFSFME